MTILLLLTGGEQAVVIVVSDGNVSLHAGATNTLLHAARTFGQRNTLYILATLTDETPDVLVDQNGDTLTAFGATPVLVLHAQSTDTILHAAGDS